MIGVRFGGILAIIAAGLLIMGACADNYGDSNGDSQAAADADSGTQQVMPTPNQSGFYQGLTIEQAAELMPFEILVPTDIPAAFELASVSVSSEPLQDGPFGDPIKVSFGFTPVDGTSENLVLVVQRKGTAILADEGVRSEVEIAGVTVTRNASLYDDGREVASYNWRTDEYSVSVHALLGESVETGDVESLIESFLQP